MGAADVLEGQYLVFFAELDKRMATWTFNCHVGERKDIEETESAVMLAAGSKQHLPSKFPGSLQFMAEHVEV